MTTVGFGLGLNTRTTVDSMTLAKYRFIPEGRWELSQPTRRELRRRFISMLSAMASMDSRTATGFMRLQAQVTARINGEDKEFESLSDYINFITSRDAISFETEYNLTVPFLCGFRRSQDGSHADDDGGRGSWKNVKLGSELTIDSIEYAVVGIKRALDKPKLH